MSEKLKLVLADFEKKMAEFGERVSEIFERVKESTKNDFDDLSGKIDKAIELLASIQSIATSM